MENFDYIRLGLINVIILIGSISIHEWAHAFAADKLGDKLPRHQGRVTLNPIAHIDLVGTIIIPLMMVFMPIFSGGTGGFALIGWGKPVQISLPNKKTRKRDDIIITAAGPLSNLLIAVLTTIPLALTIKYAPDFAQIFQMVIMLNCTLFVFNLIPIPPLDGSTFLRYLIGMREETYIMLSRWGFLILLLLINFQPFRYGMSMAISMVTVNVYKIVLILHAIIA